MRAAVVLLYGLLTAPVCLELLFSADTHCLPFGYIRLSVYGISVRLPVRVLRSGDGDAFLLRLGSKKAWPIKIPIKKRKKPGPFLKKDLKNWLNTCRFDIICRFSLGDACATALCCGGLRAIFSFLPHTDAQIMPRYGGAGFFLQVRCIAVFRLGKLFLTAARVAADRLTENFSGGSAHGNHSKPANQLRHADDP